MAKRQQPTWTAPTRAGGPTLKLFNSLTRQKEEFVPVDNRRVQWYSCGPTVYDAAHMGHARSYISFDILRRVLSDYFGYDVFYVMNITDIDDKIIKRARQTYLYDQYVKEERSLESLLDDAKQVLSMYTQTAAATNDPDKKEMMLKQVTRMENAIESLKGAVQSNDKDMILVAQNELVSEAKDPISDWLDHKYGATIVDNAIFSALPRHWEQEFHKDMDALNVLRPNVLTRVSEYIPEIIAYIEKIISNGLAYESNGSVYFDVASFDKRKQHHYAKLVPEAYGDANALAEGEGALSAPEQSGEKRAGTDFALWKRSKAGEPAWESPWGAGRPGWHIECSAMASSVCGPTLDIHTGGADLKFPHHDNELAQSEAYFGSEEWVRYFLHSGHLTIAGCKMSKSLKNFVSIQQALEKHSARQLRFAFLLHSWKDTLDYGPNTMEVAVNCEKLFNEFFLNVKDLTRDSINVATTLNTFDKWTDPELALNQKCAKAKESVHAALCDNVDTRTTLDALRELVCACNIYMRERRPVNCLLLTDIAAYVTGILAVFGAIDLPRPVGFPVGAGQAGDTEQMIMPYLGILAEFRDKVRVSARALHAQDILKTCDELRDEVLPQVGVRLEDREAAPSAVKLVPREDLLREREAKRQLEAERAAERERKKAELAATQAIKDAQKKINPVEMFLAETDKYSQFDDKGFPTRDTEGKELSKGLIKKLVKLQQAQEKRHKEYMETL